MYDFILENRGLVAGLIVAAGAIAAVGVSASKRIDWSGLFPAAVDKDKALHSDRECLYGVRAVAARHVDSAAPVEDVTIAQLEQWIGEDYVRGGGP